MSGSRRCEDGGGTVHFKQTFLTPQAETKTARPLRLIVSNEKEHGKGRLAIGAFHGVDDWQRRRGSWQGRTPAGRRRV